MKKNRKFIVIALVLVLITGAIGFGFNYFKWKGEEKGEKNALEVKGTLTVANIADKQGLVPGDKLCDAIDLKIESTATSLLRVKVDVLSDDNAMKNGYVINGINSNWIKGNDGYYYYKTAVNKDSGTIPFASGIDFKTSDDKFDMNAYQGKNIKVNIQAEMVQVKYGVFENAWGVTSSSDSEVYTLLEGLSNTQGN